MLPLILKCVFSRVPAEDRVQLGGVRLDRLFYSLRGRGNFKDFCLDTGDWTV